MEADYDDNLYNEIVFGSSPVVSNDYQIDEFKLAIGMDISRFADFDTNPIATFNMYSSFGQPSFAFQFGETNPISNLQENNQDKLMIKTKQKHKQIIFHPFTNPEATEQTVKCLRQIFIQNPKQEIKRAQSYGATNFDF